MDILKRFEMLECMVMATPMESNLKLLCNASLELVYDMIYRKMIGFLM